VSKLESVYLGTVDVAIFRFTDAENFAGL